MQTLTQPRKIFSVLFKDRNYDVFDIEGKEHEGLNGEPKTWWIYYADPLPEGMLPPLDSDDLLPWSKSINRRVWDIRFKEYNTSKEKWNSTNFRSGLNCEMWCNGKQIYSFGTFDMAFAFAKCQYLMTMLIEHSYNFFEPEKEKGRKILFYNLPATIQPSDYHPGEISIYPDYTAGIDRKEWWKLYKDRSVERSGDKEDMEMANESYDEESHGERINWGDALSDGHIWWHRK